MDAKLATALTSMAKPANPPQLKAGASLEQARKAAQDFEAVFLTTMLEGMFSGVKTDPPFGGGPSEKTYRSLLLTEYAKQIAATGGIGLTDQITRDLIALQEGAQR